MKIFNIYFIKYDVFEIIYELNYEEILINTLRSIKIEKSDYNPLSNYNCTADIRSGFEVFK